MRLSEFKQNMLVNIFAFLVKLAANEFSELFFDRFVSFYSNLFTASFQNKLHRKPAAKFRLFTLVRNFKLRPFQSNISDLMLCIKRRLVEGGEFGGPNDFGPLKSSVF